MARTRHQADPNRTLGQLERLKAQYGARAAEKKLALLRRLPRMQQRSPGAVSRLHEALCFLRAYPDSPELLALVEGLLARFARRRDLREHAEALEDSGIAGSAILYCFFNETAHWLVKHWPKRMQVDWDQVSEPERLEGLLHLLTLYAETPALDELPLELRDWVDRLKAPRETDAEFLVRRFRALGADARVREALFESLNLFLRLEPGPDTPTRTLAYVPRGEVTFQERPLSRARPDLCAEVASPPPEPVALARRDGQCLIDLARGTMVTRSRDLDAFAYGDPDDVRVYDCGDGLELAAIGVIPERRLLLEAVYGFLTLKNGVPIGYVLNSALFGSAEVAYNVFETFRGAEAAHVYGRILATLGRLFGADSFTIYPYQLGGDGNDEGLQSGAWWFYQKLGFRPKDPETLRRMRAELRKMKKRPSYRSSIATLREIAQANVFLHCGPERDDVIGVLPIEHVGLAVVDNLARHFGADRERAERVLTSQARELLEIPSLKELSPGQRLWLKRWAPLLAILPGVDRWTKRQRRDLAAVVLAKGGKRESDYVHLFDAHERLRTTITRIANRPVKGLEG